jgi:serine/threonine protein kinase
MEIPIGETLFGRYTVAEKLGEGFFGRVYRAQDKFLPRCIAIKELKSRFLGDEHVMRRFVNDARAAAALQHTNIVTVLDLLPEANPRFILLEYYPETLRQVLSREGRLPVSRSAKIAIEICSAIGLAHQRKIIHRDIKPENVLFTANGTTKVCDFGIAHLPIDLGGLGMTYGQGHPGTPIYRSPEQVRGLELDGRSDLYTLGAVLYEILTGAHYFDHSGFKSQYECDNAVLAQVPAPPSSLNPGIPPALDTVVLKLLEKQPDRRFQSAAEVVQALEECLYIPPGNREIKARPVLTTIHSSAHREGAQFRYQFKLEATNEGNTQASMAGLTIHFLNITSKEQLRAQNIRAWGNAGAGPLQFAPDDLLWAFLDNGSWGQKPSKCLMLESVITEWKPGHQMSLDVVLSLDLPRLDTRVRAWSTWKGPDGKQVSDGDPPWAAKLNLDQQGFPCYPLVVGFNG